MTTCRVCGCTDTTPCAGGCFWFQPGICSVCAFAVEVVSEWVVRARNPAVEVVSEWVVRARNPDANALIAEVLRKAEEDDEEDEPLVIL
jgi:hypothetical protein